MKSRAYSEFIQVFADLHEHLLARRLKPSYMRLENESIPKFQIELKAKNIDFQLSSPGMHHRNIAEQAISTFKYHFIVLLWSTDPDFPMQNCYCLVEQADITLNLLRPWSMNPKLSAYYQLNGTFDYIRTPMAPPGTRTLVHDKPHNRVTWVPHRKEGWYVRPAMLHYRCLTFYICNTPLEHVSDTTELFPAQKNFPSLSPADTVTSASADLTKHYRTLHHPSPFRTLGKIEQQLSESECPSSTRPCPKHQHHRLHNFWGWKHQNHHIWERDNPPRQCLWNLQHVRGWKQKIK